MKVVTAEQMRRIDDRAQSEFGLSAESLMHEAGSAVANEIRNRYDPDRVLIFCGKGNNAGDGFVIARELSMTAVEVDVISTDPDYVYHGAAAFARERLHGTRVRMHGMEACDQLSPHCNVVIDALLGTGTTGKPRGAIADAISIINEIRRPVVAVDIPSGLGAFEGQVEHEIVRADVTVTIGLPKEFMLVIPGVEYVGELVVAPINFPLDLVEDDDIALNLASDDTLRDWLPLRPLDSNKGTFGSVAVVAGSARYAGAAILCARAALRVGCGLVTIFTTKQMNGIYKSALPEAVTAVVPSEDPDWLGHESMHAIAERIGTASVVAIGPGLGAAAGQQELVQHLLSHSEKPMVIDADAINCLGSIPDGQKFLRNRKGCVMTPHPGEIGRMLKITSKDVQSDRMGTLRKAIDIYRANILLKGASTLVGEPDGQIFVVPGGSSVLAKAGTGDVLTGVIASLMAQGTNPFFAGILGAHLQLRAAAIAGSKHGERGALAGEIADAVPMAIDDLVKGA